MRKDSKTVKTTIALCSGSGSTSVVSMYVYCVHEKLCGTLLDSPAHVLHIENEPKPIYANVQLVKCATIWLSPSVRALIFPFVSFSN